MGPFLFGPTAYTTAVNGSGPQAAFRINYRAQNSWSVIGFCGTGGAGSVSGSGPSPVYIGVVGGEGGFPGGGGGGSGGTIYSATAPGSSSGAGGAGGAGRVRVWSW